MAEESKSGSGSGDLLSSGKVVAQATMSAFQQKSVEGVDKKEVAGAAADLLHSASTYGKLEDKPVGQYIEQAEGYLKSFSSGGAAAPPPPAGEAAPKPAAAEEPAAPPAEKEGSKAPASEGFGLDDVMKGAESLMEKKGGGEESAGSGGGAGGLFKMAQGFMK
ncbi:nodulin-related protein 1-like [Oryza brachyantha]|uniref:nodulin-related protein 1-like n=1 Tax=Oryza brachyantha TaxID=4533 RepID=UPI001ADA8EB8|nr:nodulin-related protein 1-like [Oryza brachyantha]